MSDDTKTVLNLDDPNVQTEIQKIVDQKVTQLTAGLTANRDTILSEKKKIADDNKQLQTALSAYQELGPQNEIQTTLEQLENHELGQLLKNGKPEQWLKTKTKKMVDNHNQVLTAMEQRAVSAEQISDKKTNQLDQYIVDQAIQNAASEVGVVSSALVDVLNRARKVFQIVDNQLVAINADGIVILGADQKPLGTIEYINDLIKVAPHLMPPSHGGGATGNTSLGSIPTYTKQKWVEKMSAATTAERANLTKQIVGGQIQVQ